MSRYIGVEAGYTSTRTIELEVGGAGLDHLKVVASHRILPVAADWALLQAQANAGNPFSGSRTAENGYIASPQPGLQVWLSPLGLSPQEHDAPSTLPAGSPELDPLSLTDTASPEALELLTETLLDDIEQFDHTGLPPAVPASPSSAAHTDSPVQPAMPTAGLSPQDLQHYHELCKAWRPPTRYGVRYPLHPLSHAHLAHALQQLHASTERVEPRRVCQSIPAAILAGQTQESQQALLASITQGFQRACASMPNMAPMGAHSSAALEQYLQHGIKLKPRAGEALLILNLDAPCATVHLAEGSNAAGAPQWHVPTPPGLAPSANILDLYERLQALLASEIGAGAPDPFFWYEAAHRGFPVADEAENSLMSLLDEDTRQDAAGMFQQGLVDALLRICAAWLQHAGHYLARKGIHTLEFLVLGEAGEYLHSYASSMQLELGIWEAELESLTETHGIQLRHSPYSTIQSPLAIPPLMAFPFGAALLAASAKT